MKRQIRHLLLLGWVKLMSSKISSFRYFCLIVFILCGCCFIGNELPTSTSWYVLLATVETSENNCLYFHINFESLSFCDSSKWDNFWHKFLKISLFCNLAKQGSEFTKCSSIIWILQSIFSNGTEYTVLTEWDETLSLSKCGFNIIVVACIGIRSLNNVIQITNLSLYYIIGSNTKNLSPGINVLSLVVKSCLIFILVWDDLRFVRAIPHAFFW